MRKRFEQQLVIGLTPISEVKFPTKSRHQLAPILLALQHIFITPELNEKVFKLLESEIIGDKKRTGRLGLSLWEILVLSSVRLSLDIDYDFLLDQANHHELLRGILGVGQSDFTLRKEYKLQNIKDNVVLLDESVLKSINNIVVEEGHKLIKKKRRRRRN